MNKISDKYELLSVAALILAFTASLFETMTSGMFAGFAYDDSLGRHVVTFVVLANIAAFPAFLLWFILERVAVILLWLLATFTYGYWVACFLQSCRRDHCTLGSKLFAFCNPMIVPFVWPLVVTAFFATAASKWRAHGS